MPLPIPIISAQHRSVENEIDHFVRCKECGQAMDLRDLWAVMHHADKGHQRLDPGEAFRLVDNPDLKAALMTGQIIVMSGRSL